ncbi:MAG: (2Fe-2S)-binding protein [Acidobacteria bacterium]|nr:(2Fe-2S)-binding protein [Acidobacteriota bacterium]
MKVPIQLTVNGELRQAEIDPRAPLVQLLRDELGLTGTHFGCLTGHCGACTVVFNGQIVKSCIVLAASANGDEVMTVEGLAQDGKLHAIQRAFWDQLGFQCGFCTPGMMMAALELLAENPDPSDDEIRAGISGNLCRCTGYQNIVKAIRAAAESSWQ